MGTLRTFAAGTLSLLAVLGCGDDTETKETGGGGQTSEGGGGQSASGGAPSVGGGGEGGEGGEGGSIEGGSFEGVDPIAGAPPVELVQGGFEFTEGPVYLADLGVVRFSDIPASDILELSLASGEITTWRADSQQTNGNAVAPNGDIVSCEHQSRSVTRSPAAGAPSPATVADRYMDMRFNSPNDVIVRSDGTVYFTDPTYGLVGQQEIPFQGVYRVDLQGVVHLVDDAYGQPNGVALSPDETVLYVTDSQDGGLYSYDVAEDGSTGERSQLVDAAPSDGMAVDDAGNVYLTTSAGVEVYDSEGTSWGTLTLAEHPANAAFGGADRRTLFITARNGFYRVPLAVPGKP